MREKGHTTIRNHSTISSISNGREVNLREYGERGVGHRKSGRSYLSLLYVRYIYNVNGYPWDAYGIPEGTAYAL